MDSATRRHSNVSAAPGSAFDPREWDFRTVGSNELITAILFEYTRSSCAARKAIEHWHTQPVNLGEFCASLDGIEPGSLAAGVLSPCGITHAEVIERIFDATPDGEHWKERLSLLQHLSTVAAFALPTNADPLIAARFSTLQKSWNELQSMLKPRNFNLRLLPPPLPRKCLQEISGKGAVYAEAQGLMPTLRKHRLVIDWAVRADKIEKALLEWARKTRQNALRGIPRRGGHQPREVLLKFLAAYRFREAGYGFQECQNIVNSHRNLTRGLESSLLVLPVYKSKGKWEDAASKAARLLAGNFAKEIRSNFGYWSVEW